MSITLHSKFYETPLSRRTNNEQRIWAVARNDHPLEKGLFFPKFHISGWMANNPAILVTSCWTVVIANTCPRCLEIQNISTKKAKEGTSSSQASQFVATLNWMEACAFTYPLVFFLLVPLINVRQIRFSPSMATQPHRKIATASGGACRNAETTCATAVLGKGSKARKSEPSARQQDLSVPVSNGIWSIWCCVLIIFRFRVHPWLPPIYQSKNNLLGDQYSPSLSTATRRKVSSRTFALRHLM